MYGRTIRLTMLLVALIAATPVGCRTARSSRATYDYAPAATASGGGCQSCQ
jgi:hypothetical protein